MAEICCDVVNESEPPAGASAAAAAAAATNHEQPSPSRAARKRRMEIRRFKFVASFSPADPTADDKEHDGAQIQKRQKVGISAAATVFTRECENAKENCLDDDSSKAAKNGKTKEVFVLCESLSPSVLTLRDPEMYPKYGVASACGRRRDMEDAVSVHPSFFRMQNEHSTTDFHYFGVYDGHGCSHVAMRCRERLHELVREELEMEVVWEVAMERSFTRMDKEAVAWNEGMIGANCRCELQTPDCDAVGSTAVVAVLTPEKVVVANCGDSRAVLCRNGKPVPLSSDHKPDRPDELDRIQAAGGRVIYWDGPRVLGVLAMSRAIGDNYLKPYVSCEPEVTVTDRTPDDDCLILASDGLWDVVSNEMACGVARMCLRGEGGALPSSPPAGEEEESTRILGGEIFDKECADASMLLMKLALARHSTDNVSVVVVDLRRDT